jgi:hypothetical protein
MRSIQDLPVVNSASTLEDFALQMRARRLIISQSSFNWWAAFLGEPEMIIAPATNFGVWAGKGEDPTDLNDRERFTFIRCHTPYQAATPAERLYYRLRALRLRLVQKLNRSFSLNLTEPSA